MTPPAPPSLSQAPMRTSTQVGAVLCGGASRRMGTDKALVTLGGRTLLERSLAVLGAVAPRVLVACGGEDRYPDCGLERVLDARPGGGPLAGLEAVLAAAGSGRVALAAVDMPRLSAEVLTALAERADEHDLDVCALETEHGLEPLCAVVHTRCLPAVRAALDAGERRMIAFHPAVSVGTVHVDELPAALRGSEPARNLNDRHDLEAERRRASGGSTPGNKPGRSAR